MAKSNYLKSRINEDYLLETTASRRDNYQAWHDRIDESDGYIRGEFPVIQPDGSTISEKPIVGNLMDQQPRDLARLACEVMPTYIAPQFKDTKVAIENAVLRGVISEGYFQNNRFEIMRPQFIMDMAVTGAAFMVLWVDTSSPFPRMMRVDPRACFPDIVNGEIQDLLVVQRMKVRQADRKWPDADILKQYVGMKDSEDGASDYVEIWDYYCSDEVVKGVGLVNGSKQVIESGLVIVSRANPQLKNGQPPVAFAQVPTPDGALRGLIDQIGPGLAAKNQAANFILSNMEQMANAPFLTQGVINPSDPPGPNTLYQVDPGAQQHVFERVPPAQFNPQLMGYMEYLDTEQRSQIAYPNARQGQISQSIASASFAQAVQGQLSSLVREVQRNLSDMQEQAGVIAQQLDEKFLDEEKPLIRSIGRKRTYKPSRDIAGQLGLTVNYGAGSGLDRLNTDVRLIQFFTAGAISLETLLANVEFVADPVGEIEKRNREEVMRIVLQRWAGDPNTAIDFMIRVSELQDDEGLTLREAMQQAQTEMDAQLQAQQQAAGMQGAASGGTPSQQPNGNQLQQGAQPPAQTAPAAIPASFSPPMAAEAINQMRNH